jgi:nucleoid-associated protein YgaU
MKEGILMSQKSGSGSRKRLLKKGKTKFFFIRNKTMILAFLLLLCSVILSFFLICTSVTAEKSTDRIKTVTSVKIEKGQSLWDIARKYMTDEYKDMNSYIKEIKESNGLISDTIHEGQYIIVPYYTLKE